MGLKERVDTRSKQGKFNQTSTICKHAFSDLTHISPLVFIYLLKACYFNGKGSLLSIINFAVFKHDSVVMRNLILACLLLIVSLSVSMILLRWKT